MGQINKLPKYGVIHEYAEASRRKADGEKRQASDARTGSRSTPLVVAGSDSLADTPADSAATGSSGRDTMQSASSARDAMKEGSRKSRRVSIADALGLTSQIALSAVLCVLIGAVSGRALDARLNTSPIMLIIGVLLGAAAAFKALYDVVKKKWMD